jgi:hypothetical protein
MPNGNIDCNRAIACLFSADLKIIFFSVYEITLIDEPDCGKQFGPDEHRHASDIPGRHELRLLPLPAGRCKIPEIVELAAGFENVESENPYPEIAISHSHRLVQPTGIDPDIVVRQHDITGT